MPDPTLPDTDLAAAAALSYLRVLLLDRRWTALSQVSVRARDHEFINAANTLNERMKTAIERSVDLSGRMVSTVENLGHIPPDVSAMLGEQLEPAGVDVDDLRSIGKEGHDQLSENREATIAELSRELKSLTTPGRVVDLDLPDAFLCGLAKCQMSAGLVLAWMPPHLHGAAVLASGVTVYKAVGCSKLR